jgi:Na+-transporting NADH:ubiquinone oxidoreductase subunit NqrF
VNAETSLEQCLTLPKESTDEQLTADQERVNRGQIRHGVRLEAAFGVGDATERSTETVDAAFQTGHTQT